jgi:hypothetical protein
MLAPSRMGGHPNAAFALYGQISAGHVLCVTGSASTASFDGIYSGTVTGLGAISYNWRPRDLADTYDDKITVVANKFSCHMGGGCARSANIRPDESFDSDSQGGRLRSHLRSKIAGDTLRATSKVPVCAYTREAEVAGRTDDPIQCRGSHLSGWVGTLDRPGHDRPSAQASTVALHHLFLYRNIA